jgi:hypothetical protein
MVEVWRGSSGQEGGELQTGFPVRLGCGHQVLQERPGDASRIYRQFSQVAAYRVRVADEVEMGRFGMSIGSVNYGIAPGIEHTEMALFLPPVQTAPIDPLRASVDSVIYLVGKS